MRSPTSAEWCGQGSSAARVSVNNWVDHGFYQFSPTFAYDYYAGGWIRGARIRHRCIRDADSRMLDMGSHCRTARAAWRREPGRSGRSDIFAPVSRSTRRSDRRSARPGASDVCAGACACSPPRVVSEFRIARRVRVERANGTSSRCGNSSKDSGFAWSVALPELQQWGDDLDRPSVSRLVRTRGRSTARPSPRAARSDPAARQRPLFTLARPRLSVYTRRFRSQPKRTCLRCRTAWPVTWCGHLLKCFAASFSK
jgi:hypothetical protein